MTVFAELERRNVLRVAAAYVAVSWLLIQVVETLFPVFELPDAAIRTVVIVLAIGFVPALVVAWAFELTPEGLVRDADVDRASPSIRASTKRLDRIVMVALALAVGYFAFDKFMLDPARDLAIAEAAKEEGRAEAVQNKRDAGPPVIAVLPFSAVTATEDSQFFAAGVHDDLLTKLAQLPSMLVISRTSVMEYKDVQRNIRAIGDALGADAILEGGVQSAGNRIRINAQLIDAETDEHLWAETYDRELTTASIFDVQDDIARAIAEALQTTFTAAAQKTIPTQNMAAYRAWHNALTVRDSISGGHTSDEYRAYLEEAAELDPTFTRPLAELVGSLALSVIREKDAATIERAEETLNRIRVVAPNSVDFLMAQTYYTYYVLNDYDLAHEIAKQALALTPSDTRLLQIKSWIERRQGDFDARVETMKLARKLSPGTAIYTGGIVNNLILLHRYDEAAEELAAIDEDLAETDEDKYWFERTRAMLEYREHRDVGRLARRIVELVGNSDDRRMAIDAVMAHTMNREFDAALALVDQFPIQEAFSPGAHFGVSDRLFSELILVNVMGDSDRRPRVIEEAKVTLLEHSTEEQRTLGMQSLTMALVAAAEGRSDDAVDHVNGWLGGYGTDWADRSSVRDLACQILGLARAGEAAVQCIRDGLEEPSFIMPSLEPLWPTYDPIRDEPVFIELVEELGV